MKPAATRSGECAVCGRPAQRVCELGGEPICETHKANLDDANIRWLQEHGILGWGPKVLCRRHASEIGDAIKSLMALTRR
jgi:hypothetical protein